MGPGSKCVWLCRLYSVCGAYEVHGCVSAGKTVFAGIAHRLGVQPPIQMEFGRHRSYSVASPLFWVSREDASLDFRVASGGSPG